MKVFFHAEEHDYFTNIEKAKAIIDVIMQDRPQPFEVNLIELEEIKDYIDVYIKHKKGEIEYERNRKSCGDY